MMFKIGDVVKIKDSDENYNHNFKKCTFRVMESEERNIVIKVIKVPPGRYPNIFMQLDHEEDAYPERFELVNTCEKIRKIKEEILGVKE